MFLVNQAMVDLNVGTAGLIALLRYVWFVSTIVEDGRYLKLNNSGKIFNFYLGK